MHTHIHRISTRLLPLAPRVDDSTDSRPQHVPSRYNLCTPPLCGGPGCTLFSNRLHHGVSSSAKSDTLFSPCKLGSRFLTCGVIVSFSLRASRCVGASPDSSEAREVEVSCRDFDIGIFTWQCPKKVVKSRERTELTSDTYIQLNESSPTHR